MAVEVIQVDDSKVVIGLGRFSLSLQQNQDMMKAIALSQLESVRKTFREEGVPAGSWVPLAPSTIRSLGAKAAGHKLLIRSGRLLNSIRVMTMGPGYISIGTNKAYAAVHQFGSRDRSVAIGPKSKAESEATVNVKTHGYFRLSSELGVGKLQGRGRRRIQGPRNSSLTIVEKHGRHQNIPPRPYLVFRPEDPQRIRGIVVQYVANAAKQAGLGGAK